MALEWSGEIFCWHCDSCGEYSDEYHKKDDDFHDTWDLLKAQGWRAFKHFGSNDDWQHKCPGCRGKAS